MKISTVGIALLLLGPIVAASLAGFGEVAKYVGIGSVLAVLLGLLARPVAAFAVLLPVVYAAAALTVQSTNGVVALIVAIAAAVGAAGSLGLQRGLVALLGAALLGSFEPAAPVDVLRRSGLMLLGIGYGFGLAVTVLRHVSVAGRAVRPQATVGYAVLLAVLVLVAWYAARLGGLAYAWWLPLAVVAVSEPVAKHSAWHALARTAGVLCATLALVTIVTAVDAHWLRGVLLAALVLVALWHGVRHPTLVALLLTPVLVLLSSLGPPGAGLDGPAGPEGQFTASLIASLVIFAATCLGHWAFWTLRTEPERVTA
jgi:hypothetical protein